MYRYCLLWPEKILGQATRAENFLISNDTKSFRASEAWRGSDLLPVRGHVQIIQSLDRATGPNNRFTLVAPFTSVQGQSHASVSFSFNLLSLLCFTTVSHRKGPAIMRLGRLGSIISCPFVRQWLDPQHVKVIALIHSPSIP